MTIQMTQNQESTVKNKDQGDTKKVLVVCSVGLLRSPTAAKVLAEEYGYNTRSAGMLIDFTLIPITNALVYWADEIVFMDEDNYLSYLVQFRYENVAKGKDTQILNIPDDFNWGDEDLIRFIKQAYKVN